MLAGSAGFLLAAYSVGEEPPLPRLTVSVMGELAGRPSSHGQKLLLHVCAAFLTFPRLSSSL